MIAAELPNTEYASSEKRKYENTRDRDDGVMGKTTSNMPKAEKPAMSGCSSG